MSLAKTAFSTFLGLLSFEFFVGELALDLLPFYVILPAALPFVGELLIFGLFLTDFDALDGVTVLFLGEAALFTLATGFFF